MGLSNLGATRLKGYHFAGLDFLIEEAAAFADEKGVEVVRTMFNDAGVQAGVWVFPVNYRFEITKEEG